MQTHRYLIIGAGGSGKSTLAKLISEKLQIPYFDTDSLYWQPGWSLSSDESVVSQLPLNSNDWVIDGNFVQHREEVWRKADHIIWLKRFRPLVLGRVMKRNLWWWWTQKPTWSGNSMPFKIAVTGILHTLSQLYRHPKEFSTYLKDFPEKNIKIISTEKDLQDFLNSLSVKN